MPSKEATNGTLIGYVVECVTKGMAMTIHVDCSLERDTHLADIEDSYIYEDEVPYPECARCGGVIRG